MAKTTVCWYVFILADTAILLGSLSRGKSNIENGEEDRSTQSSPLGTYFLTSATRKVWALFFCSINLTHFMLLDVWMVDMKRYLMDKSLSRR